MARGRPYDPAIELRALTNRLSRGRYASGDFRRLLGAASKSRTAGTGVFLDPTGAAAPAGRRTEGHSSRAAALALFWAVERGDDPDLRIALVAPLPEFHPDLARARWSTVMAETAAYTGRCERVAVVLNPACAGPV